MARNVEGSWLGGVGRNIGRCSVEQTELWASYYAFLLAWDAKWVNIIVETDCAQALTAIFDKSCDKSNKGLVIRI